MGVCFFVIEKVSDAELRKFRRNLLGVTRQPHEQDTPNERRDAEFKSLRCNLPCRRGHGARPPPVADAGSATWRSGRNLATAVPCRAKNSGHRKLGKSLLLRQKTAPSCDGAAQNIGLRFDFLRMGDAYRIPKSVRAQQRWPVHGIVRNSAEQRRHFVERWNRLARAFS